MIYDLIIIGSGPAGITAGIYAARKQLKTLLITRDFIGQLGKISEIENWPGFSKITGMDLVEKLSSHLKNFEIKIREATEAKEIYKKGDIFEVETKKSEKLETKAIIVASGMSHRKLGIPGEDIFESKGVSVCSTCDAPFFKNKIVAVVGGGNSGFRTALDLIPYASKIYLYEASGIIRADEVFQEQAKQSGKIEVFAKTIVKEIKGTKIVEKIVIEDLTNKETKEVEVGGVFIEIGSIPATEFLNDWVEFDEKGAVKINSATCETKTPGIFAAGDITNIPYRQLIIASGDGAKAALSAYEYLRDKK